MDIKLTRKPYYLVVAVGIIFFTFIVKITS